MDERENVPPSSHCRAGRQKVAIFRSYYHSVRVKPGYFNRRMSRRQNSYMSRHGLTAEMPQTRQVDELSRARRVDYDDILPLDAWKRAYIHHGLIERADGCLCAGYQARYQKGK